MDKIDQSDAIRSRRLHKREQGKSVPEKRTEQTGQSAAEELRLAIRAAAEERRRREYMASRRNTSLTEKTASARRKPLVRNPEVSLYSHAERLLRQEKAAHSYPLPSVHKRLVKTRLGIAAKIAIFPLCAAAIVFFCSVFAETRQQPLQDFSPLLQPRTDVLAERYLATYAGLGSFSIKNDAENQFDEILMDLDKTFSWIPYTVRSGDTISKIAVNYGVSWGAIIASNSIERANDLKAGSRLRIPNIDGVPYTVKSGDTFVKIAASVGVPLEVILDANDIQNDIIVPGAELFIPGASMPSEDLKMALGELFIYPIRGRLTSPFGWRDDPINGERRYHEALDLAAAMGTPIKAARDGRVATVGRNATYGNYIILTHTGGYQTMYAHMSVTSVKQGVYVMQGGKIGEVGSTGYSTGPHLHFAIYKSGKAVNPLEFLDR
ncbi:hypothetical protein FACS1894151_03070 [Spirochaetia bacterium]|nr:hypothetical protein FACS1894151_03070 [Spirochaetia bacterium]